VTDVAGYRDYVAVRLDQLRRTGYLLCGDWHTADDLVSTALVKLYRHWRRVSTMDNIDGYVRQMLLRAWLDERRRPWRREHPRSEGPEPAGRGPDRQIIPGVDVEVTDRLTILAHLADLPPRRRAVLVLRFYLDLSVEDTAEALGCSTGTVKSQTARALDALRARMAPVDQAEEVRWTS
jgi:RNA polymerase sigma-70 factor (sigma-E family)